MVVNVKALLKHVPSVVYLYAALAVLVVGGYNAWAYQQRQIGKRELELVQMTHDLRQARREADSLAKVYRVDTVRFRVIKTQVDTLTRVVESWKHDTLRVVEYVTKADSAIKACSAVVLTCEERVGAVQRALDASEKANHVLRLSMPNPAQKWLYGAIGLGTGLLARSLVK